MTHVENFGRDIKSYLMWQMGWLIVFFNYYLSEHEIFLKIKAEGYFLTANFI